MPTNRRILRSSSYRAQVFIAGLLVVYIAVCGSTSAIPSASQLSQADSQLAALNRSTNADQNPGSTTRKQLTPGHEKMLTILKEIAVRTPETNDYLGGRLVKRLRGLLLNLPTKAPDLIRWRLHMEIAEGELRLGNETEAIAEFTQARQLIPQLRGALSALEANRTLFRLGVAYMRRGETQNCCQRHTPESCILPLQKNAIHTQKESSWTAIKYFTEVLRNTVDRTPLHLEAKWLLNIAYMTVGNYPSGVPGPYLIPQEAFQSQEKIPRFENVAPYLGLDSFDMSGGAVADDFDDDGYLDLMVSSWDPTRQIRFFKNKQDGSFLDQTQEAGLIGLYGGLNLVQADYDNDGDIDILVLRGAWLEQTGRHPNSLLRNNGDGTFTDITFEAGLGGVHYPTQTAAWSDYDNDGDLDLYIGNETTKALKAPCQLFRNNGDGTFIDVSLDAGVQNHRFTKAVIWGDYDGDRFPDLYVSNFKGGNRLYRNNRDGSFSDVARELHVNHPVRSFPAWFWDFDNDSVLDLYVSAYSAGISHLAASALGVSVQFPDAPNQTNPNAGGTASVDRKTSAEAGTKVFSNESNSDEELPHLYRGNGNGGFEEVATDYNLEHPSAPMGSNFGDLDNDGYLDFYLGTGYPDYKQIMPNLMFRNKRGSGFVDVTYAGGFGHLQKGHSVVFADLDNDGDQDIFEQMGGAFPGDKYGNALFENPGFGNRWLTIRLIGVRSNRSAIGARIHLVVIENQERRSIYKHVNSGGSFGANPLRQTIGLGQAEKIETLEVFWPTTGITQTFSDLPLNRFIQIVEDEDKYAILPVKEIEFARRVSAEAIASNRTRPISASDRLEEPKIRRSKDGASATFNQTEGTVALLASPSIKAKDKKEPEPTPEFAEYYNHGLDRLQTENYIGAADAFKKAIEIDPAYDKAHYTLGRIFLINLGKTAEAVERLTTAVTLAPNNARAHQMLGVAHFKRNAYRHAIPALRRAVELGVQVEEDYPYHPYYDLGMVYLKQDEFDEAIRCFEQAIQLHPDQIRAYYGLGNALIRKGDVKNGAEQIRKYQALKPYLNLVSQLEIAVRRTPNNPERWYQLGRLHAQYGRFEKAIVPLQRSIELNPHDWKVFNILSVCYMRLNQFDKMEETCKAAVRLAPNEANVHNSLGMSYLLQGKYHEAMDSFETTILLDEDNPEFRENLAKVYEALGKVDKASNEREKAQRFREKHKRKQE